jgi:hypothetical protein
MVEIKCKYCNTAIIKKDKRALFCNKTCSATYNNKICPKRQLEGSCKKCNTAISKRLKFCGSCIIKNKEEFIPKKRDLKKAVKSIVSWRQRTKIKAIEYKGGKCINCGYDRCVRALQFHHLDSTKKDFTISGVSRSWDTIKIELDKCILICANCHAEEHDKLDKK